MALEEFPETWIRVDLYCDGLAHSADEIGRCVLDAQDDLGMLSDVANNAEGARAMLLHYATTVGWRFDIELKRWLCPDCVAARDANAGQSKD